MSDLTPRSQKIPIENSPFSSATHLNSLNFSIFTQKYYELRSLKQNDQQSLARKKLLKIFRNYLKVERNNILFNFFVAKKIHNSRKQILQSHFLSKWHEKYMEKINNKNLSNENQVEENNQIIQREIEVEENNQITQRETEIDENKQINDNESNSKNMENSTPSTPVSPNSRKLIRKQYSDKSTDTIEIPDPTLFEKIKSINFKTIILLFVIAIAACAGTYYGFHYYFKHNKYDQLYRKHKYESTLPPHDKEADDDIVIDYSKAFPEDGDLIHLMKNLVNKVKNIKSKQTELNEQVQHIQESLVNEEGENIDEQQVPQELTSNKNEDSGVDSSNNISSKEESIDQVK